MPGSLPGRRNRLRSAFRSRNLDAVLEFSPPRIRYLTGFTGSTGIMVLTGRACFLVTDGRYALQCREEARGVRCIIAKGGLVEEIARRGLLRDTRRVGFEPDDVSCTVYRLLKRQISGIRLLPASGLLDDLMMVKDQGEIALIREAIAISEQVLRDVLGSVAPGRRELDLAGEISFLHRAYGGEGDAFEPIVAAGPRSALPHARASTRIIRRGDLLTLDIGCVRGGYCSDITRTVVVGGASRRVRGLYRAVHEAQAAALDAARGGLDARALDAVARRVITLHGFGTLFMHSLGHGLGLRVHERPRISPRSQDRLRAGSVVTIEPGVYLPGVGGVRIEDDILLTDRGCEVLSAAPRELLTI